MSIDHIEEMSILKGCLYERDVFIGEILYQRDVYQSDVFIREMSVLERRFHLRDVCIREMSVIKEVSVFERCLYQRGFSYQRFVHFRGVHREMSVLERLQYRRDVCTYQRNASIIEMAILETGMSLLEMFYDKKD